MVLYINELRRESLYDRIENLLVSFQLSDCSFTVSDKDFKAHRLILSISSPVFEAMFYGQFSNTDSIQITDIEPDIFQLLLNYIYTDKLVLSSIDQAFELLYASRKYLLDHLSELCIKYIQTNMSINNVISVLNYPEYMQDNQLMSFALKLFCEHADYLLEENITLISCSCMKAILEKTEMNIKEKDLIKYVFEWSSVYCKQNEIPVNIDNRRNLLQKNGLLNLLRFKSLSLEEIDEISADKSNILSHLEIEHIKELIMKTNDGSDLKSDQQPRQSLKIQWRICHRTALKPVAPFTINSNNYKIHCRIKANKTLFINSLSVPTRMAPLSSFYPSTIFSCFYTEEFSVYIACETDNSLVKVTNYLRTIEYDSTVDVKLSDACLIQKDKWYKVSFIWPRNKFNNSSYILECRDKCFNDHRVTFEFDDTLSSLNGGSFLGGLEYSL